MANSGYGRMFADAGLTYLNPLTRGCEQESCGTLTLDDKDPILVEKVLEYLYTGNYTLEPGASSYDEANTAVEPVIY